MLGVTRASTIPKSMYTTTYLNVILKTRHIFSKNEHLLGYFLFQEQYGNVFTWKPFPS